ncbi:GNAT family acetyltransferase [Marinomonas mediterranea]|jgi:Acetyltransferases|uniref:GCN5-related N-acetyltransferase n=1 Tax=Marinomonas mediterranea (strain ATCC 700492 / JCM 21426 / NBRC 103028 / MMB-1) TaxID=717774 RepID=F2JW82_MARM1|nr:GNAT family acetyltransferase [Marinomonas mediterranea]ADZ89470.1 GCN5-related N-acetyltransferase [Marinomonas mediterranea MMB-1]WCN07565.1 GNAT family acetyltransferase [Marinomonas mediterranea]WCN11663.1 GNAT family acetyltransferase [Marinomonas mediterranea]WCN15721.1 GNAT family acetyltransferase [Marinomonas mediterranea MMB-1]
MTIRRVQPIDLEQLIELWEIVFPNDPPHNAPHLVLPAKLEVDDLILVSWEEGKLIGACMLGYDGHRGWLYEVAVHPDHRRKGVGTALIKSAFETLASLGCGKLNLQIRTANAGVVAFYESVGFEVEERISMGKHLA